MPSPGYSEFAGPRTLPSMDLETGFPWITGLGRPKVGFGRLKARSNKVNSDELTDPVMTGYG